MANWTAGYAADVDYTFGYFTELNPQTIKLALIDAGIQPPDIQAACELGFGQGISVNIHAAGSSTKWFGTDFSPSQAGLAQDLAKASENQAQLYDQAFAEFVERDDLPDFDFIGLHGTWTWVSDENRQILVDFIARKLKVGGALYISYNSQAGWANMAPIRHLLNQHAEHMAVQGSHPIEKVQKAFEFAEQLLAINPGFLQANPQARKSFDIVKNQDPVYLAHEYFSADWKPMTFSDMANWLAPTKCDYVCSAHSLDEVNAINLTQAEEELINQQTNPIFRETVRDLCMNQQFRRDIWVKGLRPLDRFEQMEQLMKLRLVMTQVRNEIDLNVNGMLGPLKLKAETYNPILDFFADYQVKTFGELQSAMQKQGIPFEKVMQAVMILTGKNALAVAQEPTQIDQARHKTAKLNRFILMKARGNDAMMTLASPVTGGGIELQGYEMLFMLAIQFGHDSAERIAPFVWGLLKQRGIKLLRDNKWLETDEENLAELRNQLDYFLDEPVKLYRALDVI